MSAGRFVGRVGGLAIALGVGVIGAAANPGAVASADDDGGSSGHSAETASAPTNSRPHRSAARSAAGAGATDAVARGSVPAGAATVTIERNDPVPRLPDLTVPVAPDLTVPAPAPIEPLPDSIIEPHPVVEASVPVSSSDAPDAGVGVNFSVAENIPRESPAIVTAVPDAPVATASPAGTVRGVVTTVDGSAFDQFAGLGDLIPTDSPLAWALLAVARRQAPGASSTGQPAAQVTASALLGADTISTSPTVVWRDGVLTGTLAATTSTGDPLSYVGVSAPSLGGKLGGGPLLPLTNFGPGGSFSYIPYASTLTDATQTETFTVMVLENSPFDQFVEKLLGPLGSLLVPQVLAVVHRIPLVGDLLSPIIGQSETVTFTVTPSTLAGGRPTAFTYQMPSFDGTLISVNYFPAVNVANGTVGSAPTVLAASGLACAANTDPNTLYGQLFPAAQFGSVTPGIKPLREDAFNSGLLGGPKYNGGGGYNVVTWDPRGEFASEGQLNIDNPMLEGRDVSSIISWLTTAANPAKAQVKTEAGDPLVGMTGGSYGGGIQLTTVDPRIDAITPEIAWNSLISSLYPNDTFKSGWGTILAAALAFTGARVNPAIYEGIFTGALFGFLSPSSQAVLASAGPTTLLAKEQAPTMLFQGIQDTLFPLAQSVANGQTIQTSPADVPLKLFWFCGGHGDCDIPNIPAEQDAQGVIQNLQWLDQYVAKQGTPADAIKTFQWYDEEGLYYNSDYLPWDTRFNDGGTYSATGAGGFLPIWPGPIGGSGPYPINDLPFSIVNAGPAWNSVEVDLTPPAGRQVVGAPTLTFTYSGLGTSQAVFAQLVDNNSGLVLSNIVTPVPVTLDGKTRTVTIPMEAVVYTPDAGDTLTLQITGSAVNYLNAWTYGGVAISDVTVDLPQHIKVTPTPWTP